MAPCTATGTHAGQKGECHAQCPTRLPFEMSACAATTTGLKCCGIAECTGQGGQGTCHTGTTCPTQVPKRIGLCDAATGAVQGTDSCCIVGKCTVQGKQGDCHTGATCPTQAPQRLGDCTAATGAAGGADSCCMPVRPPRATTTATTTEAPVKKESWFFQQLVTCFSGVNTTALAGKPVEVNMCHWLLPAIVMVVMVTLIVLVVFRTIDEVRREAEANKEQEEAELLEHQNMTSLLNKKSGYPAPPPPVEPSVLEDVDALTRRSRRHLATTGSQQSPESKSNLPNLIQKHANKDKTARDLAAHKSMGDVISHLWRAKPKGALGHVWRRRLIRWWKHGY